MSGKFASRKFLAFLMTYAGVVVLGILSKLDGTSIIVGLLVNTFLYAFVEGVLDLASVKTLKMRGFMLEKDKEGEDE
ncbi:MAG: hypothetical protein ABDH28_00715 [Brevinematia bacterium]